jgi:hypothetical protein
MAFVLPLLTAILLAAAFERQLPINTAAFRAF